MALEVEPDVEPEPVELALQAVLETEAIATPLDEEEAARREEVRRMVAEARHQLPSSVSTTLDSWTEPHRGGDVDSTSEGSWPMARRPGLPIIPPGARMTFDESIEPSVSHESTGPEANPEFDARRDEVARMVAAMRAGLDPAEDTGVEAPADAAGERQDDWRRDDVAKVVAEPRADIGAETEETEAEPGVGDETARREGVAEMVARLRTEMGESEDEGESASDDADSPAGDKDVRDEVRRAVEAARAEMASGWVKDEAETAGGEVKEKPKFSFPDWQTTHLEPMGPPVIVIKDPEGRVELARVYETLAQVHCDENAALLNYTPHSVTVGLNTRASVPTKDAMEKAIETVFGRRCRVESDGVRVSVDIGMGENAA
jgi:hypothetical protein